MFSEMLKLSDGQVRFFGLLCLFLGMALWGLLGLWLPAGRWWRSVPYAIVLGGLVPVGGIADMTLGFPLRVATAELVTGSNLDPADRDELQRAAVDGGATLFGSGMNPGFAQLLAAVATGISLGVDQVVVSESVDVAEFVGDANFEAMGWGRPGGDPGHADDVRAGTVVFAEAVEVLGRLLGIERFDEIRCDVAFAHATEAVQLTELRIEAGHVAGMDVNWSGVLDGRDAVQVRQRWLATPLVDPPWTVEHGYRIEVTGDPNLNLKLDIWPTAADLADLTEATMHGIGMRITAVPVVNAIPAVCAAAPGLATYADLPVITSPLRRSR